MQFREHGFRCASKGAIFILHLSLAGMLYVSAADAQHNPCPYLNDGDCDEPEGLGFCAEGTDVADCSNPNSNYGTGRGYAGGGGGSMGTTGNSAGALHNSCPYLNDGDCDEPEGLGFCAEGTDVADCSNPNSNYGTGSGYAGGGGSRGAGAGGSTEYAYAAWGSNDFQSQFNRYGGVSPLNMTYSSGGTRNGSGFPAGVYDIYLADAGPSGTGPYTGVDRYTVRLNPNTVYTVDMNQNYTSPASLRMNTNWGLTSHYGRPGDGRASIFVNNTDTSDWRAICVLPTGTPVAQCGTAVGQSGSAAGQTAPTVIDLFGVNPVP